jgi:hypothetical protein
MIRIASRAADISMCALARQERSGLGRFVVWRLAAPEPGRTSRKFTLLRALVFGDLAGSLRFAIPTLKPAVACPLTYVVYRTSIGMQNNGMSLSEMHEKRPDEGRPVTVHCRGR